MKVKNISISSITEVKVLGDINYRNKKCPLESFEQTMFFDAIKRLYPDLGVVATHIHNEGAKSYAQVNSYKSQGMKTGACDIIIPCSPPILIELKRQDHTLSKTNINQVEYLKNAEKLGAICFFALGAKPAIDEIRKIRKL